MWDTMLQLICIMNLKPDHISVQYHRYPTQKSALNDQKIGTGLRLLFLVFTETVTGQSQTSGIKRSKQCFTQKSLKHCLFHVMVHCTLTK